MVRRNAALDWSIILTVEPELWCWQNLLKRDVRWRTELLRLRNELKFAELLRRTHGLTLAMR